LVFYFTQGKKNAFKMEKEQLGYFKNLLSERLEVLISEATKTMADMTDEKETFPDPTDRASLETDRNFLLRIRDRERRLILKIREAINRIENGTYGICEECGEDISKQRLEVRPVTTLCIECKKVQEAEEKVK
jgi:DnaK suppressor protein